MVQPSNDGPSTNSRVCPASYAGFLSTGLRRLVQNPDKILGEFTQEGQACLDIGCGPGFFTLALARIVGAEGRVIAVDLQQEMLDKLKSRAEAEGLASRIRFHNCRADQIGLDDSVDFALAFYMVHEVPDQESFFAEVHSLIKPGGRFLVVEPKFHVSEQAFKGTIDIAHDAGFKLESEPAIFFSRSMLFSRD